MTRLKSWHLFDYNRFFFYSDSQGFQAFASTILIPCQPSWWPQTSPISKRFTLFNRIFSLFTTRFHTAFFYYVSFFLLFMARGQNTREVSRTVNRERVSRKLALACFAFTQSPAATYAEWICIHMFCEVYVPNAKIWRRKKNEEKMYKKILVRGKKEISWFFLSLHGWRWNLVARERWADSGVEKIFGRCERITAPFGMLRISLAPE